MISEGSIDTSSDHAAELHTLIGELGAGCAFGPTFFVAQLGRLVRERCPDPQEGLPSVQLHLHDGERLDLCHVIGFAPHWAALAVWENGLEVMRTELVPYGSIARVSIGAPRGRGARVGFEQSHAPVSLGGTTMTPEQALRAASPQSERR